MTDPAPQAAPTPRRGLPRTAPAVVDPQPTAPPAAAPVSPAPGRGRTVLGIRSNVAALGALGLVVLAALVVVLARWLVSLPAVAEFVRTYPGHVPPPDAAPSGIPSWLAWQHFFNFFLLVLMVRSGWQVRTQERPPATWVRDNTRLIRTKNPPRRISIYLWFHLSLDALWLLNGLVFVVLLFATGQWMRVVPLSWDVVPHAASVALQYASLDWPTDDGWVNYNSLQVLAYFVTIFVAAPLAAVTGLRMSGAWPADATRLNRVYPVELARAVHFPVMLYFVVFVVVHVALVLATGALRNLNHMYGGQDAVNWVGFAVFCGSLLVTAGALAASRPFILATIANLSGGQVGR